MPAPLAIMCAALLAGLMAAVLQPQAVAQFVVSPLLTLLPGITGWRIIRLPNRGPVADKPL